MCAGGVFVDFNGTAALPSAYLHGQKNQKIKSVHPIQAFPQKKTGEVTVITAPDGS
jgi:hypothetical protein